MKINFLPNFLCLLPFKKLCILHFTLKHLTKLWIFPPPNQLSIYPKIEPYPTANPQYLRREKSLWREGFAEALGQGFLGEKNANANAYPELTRINQSLLSPQSLPMH